MGELNASLGVRAITEDLAGAGVNEDRGAVEEHRRAVVSTELDLPNRGVAVGGVNLQRRQVALASRLLDDGLLKGHVESSRNCRHSGPFLRMIN
jgi:hypothetical protein